MTRLEKYLQATADSIIYAETTESRYFIIGNIKIRVSDHFSKNTDADLQVIVPFNGGSKYMVTIRDSNGKMLLWNAQQIKDFISPLSLIKSLQEPIQKGSSNGQVTAVTKIQQALKNPLEKEQLTFNREIINSKIKKNKCSSLMVKVLEKSKSTWNMQEISALSQLFKQEFGTGSINEDVQIFLTCTSINYKEILNIYKIIVIDNKKKPTIGLLQEAYRLISDCPSN